ncbi:MAG: heavy metal translocating P-type ATPase, partial [Xanthobacteraceae bacterium]
MSCCAPGAEFAVQAVDPETAREEVRLASHAVGEGLRQTDLSVPGVHCGACIRTVETALAQLPGVVQARVNLSTRRVTIRWRDDAPPAPFIATLNAAGYDAHLFEAGGADNDEGQSELVRALAVAGFGASNIMLLSVSVWSGAEPATRDLFHWISALIALPTVAYAGRVFFRSAWRALSHGRTNMDVPISIGVLLAIGLSLYETFHSGAHAYFDASVTLLFFLLIGRTLDHIMRERARTAVKGLARLAARGALVLRADGSRDYLPIDDIAPGMRILLAAGERVPVDAHVIAGQSELDCALVSGESLPQPAAPGTALQAGTLNLTGPLTIEATAAAKDSFLAEMMRMMEAAEGGRSAYRRISDRAAQLYAPVVHLTALLTCIGWVLVSGDWHRALTIAIAVLIITCPCALGLAVPMVQVVAARRLFEAGVMVRDGTALERLATIDGVVFDKTGTLTLGQPRLVNSGDVPPRTLAIASALAAHSRHPYSRALVAAGGPAADIAFEAVTEQPGLGLEARSGDAIYRLGRAGWALGKPADGDSGTVLARNGDLLARFDFEDRLRPGAEAAVATLKAQGLAVEILSGDRDAAVRALAEHLGVSYRADVRPGDKTARIAALKHDGGKPLMVGDGLNDAPALAAAHASM